ncbi:gcn5-related n-acetyltransferase [Spathaspora passalidarum NRRL Y-27907]|uniref:Gcn5-related n-acetyltransferase n=1 Tax=Spathaspora passalidarum (strain NRRL Y-27907 / 11-Y1) TaxID=619300 RepID=G3AEE9_SPAPN|nr:gcn5-related n-acetyltransferase [Spathaspora passalidarum NRRL Y-27907]EGW35737.1 gcn5-related n-acetyltransferase [Spathaspora passalidarum NRRL Y-27907]
MSPSAVLNTNQYELVHLTDKEVIQFTRRQNSEAWKGRLSSEDYVLREHVLGKSKITSSDVNRLVVYMMRRVEDGTPLCSIELLIRKSWKFTFDETTNQVVQHDILSGCIGGVFTYPEHRKKGYARIMVDKLVKVAKSELLGEDGFTFLYSEVGEYYTKNGFLSLPVDLMNTPVDMNDDKLEQDPDVKDSQFELVDYHNFEPLMNDYITQFKQSIISKVQADHKTRVAVVPTSDIVDWFHLRSKYISYKLFHQDKAHNAIDFWNESYNSIRDKLVHNDPFKFGLKLYNADKSAVTAFIVWTMEWASTTENYASVLKTVVFEGDKDATTIKLLKLMKNYLIKNPIVDQTTSKIVIWESEVSSSVKEFLVNEWNTKHGIENSSRSAILINNQLEDEQLKSNELIWEGNDKIPWF